MEENGKTPPAQFGTLGKSPKITAGNPIQRQPLDQYLQSWSTVLLIKWIAWGVLLHFIVSFSIILGGRF